MKYVVSDLHGEYDKFIKLLNKINFSSHDTLYILGDVIDRGKDSIKLLQYIINHKKNIKMNLGNHEDMMLKSICDNNMGYYKCWMTNGGYSTSVQFDKLNFNEQTEIIDYLKDLPLYRIVDNFVLVHAGVIQDIFCQLKSIKNFMKYQDEETLLWNRPKYLESPFKEEYKLIFGHSPTSYLYNDNIYPLRIYYNQSKDRIGIDCGCYFNGGRLGCLCLDDMTEYYI